MKIINTDTFLAMCLYDRNEISYENVAKIRKELASDFRNIPIRLNPNGINQALHLYGNSNSENNFFEYRPSSDSFRRGNEWDKKEVSLELFWEPARMREIPIGAMISKMKEYNINQER